MTTMSMPELRELLDSSCMWLSLRAVLQDLQRNAIVDFTSTFDSTYETPLQVNLTANGVSVAPARMQHALGSMMSALTWEEVGTVYELEWVDLDDAEQLDAIARLDCLSRRLVRAHSPSSPHPTSHLYQELFREVSDPRTGRASIGAGPPRGGGGVCGCGNSRAAGRAGGRGEGKEGGARET